MSCTIQVVAEIAEIDQNATDRAGWVLSKLRDQHLISTSNEMQLLQGMAVRLTERGFGFVLHTTDAEGIRNQALDYAQESYNRRFLDLVKC